MRTSVFKHPASARLPRARCGPHAMRSLVGALGLLSGCLWACGLPGDGAPGGDDPQAALAQQTAALTAPELDETVAVIGRPPSLSKVEPALGPDTGGVDITLTGRNFRPGVRVEFAGTVASSVTVLSSSQLRVTLPAKPGLLGRVPVRITLPDGRFVERADLFAYYSDDVALRPPRITPGVDTSDLVLGDMDKDGKLDVVTCSQVGDSVSVFLSNGNHTFRPPKTQPSGDSSTALALGDLNADGKLDVLVANEYANAISVLLGNGDGTLQTVVSYPAGRYPDTITVGDINGDGKLDVLSNDWVNDSFSLFIGNGDGTLKAAVPVSIGIKTVRKLHAVDLNNDKKLDVVATNSSGVNIALGNGDGTFGMPIVAAGMLSSGASTLADLNSDGKIDLLLSSDSGRVHVLLGVGDGKLQPPVTYVVGGSPMWLLVGQFDGDGKLDVLSGGSYWLGSPTAFSLALGNGDGTLGAVRGIPTNNSGSVAAAGDIDGDGKADLVVGISGQSLHVLPGNGNGAFQDGQNIPTGGSGSAAIAHGDWNGDGKPDVAVANFSLGSVGVLLGNGLGYYDSPRLATVGKSPSAMAAADMNGV